MESAGGAGPEQRPGLLERVLRLGKEPKPKKSFISLFIASAIFLAASHLVQLGLGNLPYFGAFLLLPLAIIYKWLGKNPALVFAGTSIAYLIFTGVGGVPTLHLHMSFLSLALYFLWDKREELLRGCGRMPTKFGRGVMIFLAMLLAVGLANLVIHFALFPEGEATIELIPELPLYLLIMSFTLGPVSEELFFRAFLVPRSGILGSSALFAIIHAIYGSMAGVGGAFVLGLVLAWGYRQLKDPVPCIIAHMLFNLLSVSLILWA
jgi:membrane protease YdiL (CAAX protease family)